MSIFANDPVGKVKVICKNCGNSCLIGKDLNFCPKCGNQILGIPKNRPATIDDFLDFYNHFYNRSQDIFSDPAKVVFEFTIKALYANVELDTLPIINSSLKSGYSVRLAEESIFDKSTPLRMNTKSNIDLATKYIKETDIDVSSLDEVHKNLLALGVFLTVDEKYHRYYLGGDSMNKYLSSIIHDNIEFLVPELEKIYEGKTIMRTMTGHLPHVYQKPIHFDSDLKSRWLSYINNDTIFGYCLRMAESYI
jgi:hypothetical protein